MKYGEDYSLDPVDWFLHFGLPIVIGLLVKYAGEKSDETRKRREGEERFKRIIDQSPSVYELYDQKGLQIDVNKAYEDLWEFPEGRVKEANWWAYRQEKKQFYDVVSVIVNRTMVQDFYWLMRNNAGIKRYGPAIVSTFGVASGKFLGLKGTGGFSAKWIGE